MWKTNPKWPEELRPDRCGAIFTIGHEFIVPHAASRYVYVASTRSPYTRHNKVLSNLRLKLIRQGHIVIWTTMDQDDSSKDEHCVSLEPRLWPNEKRAAQHALFVVHEARKADLAKIDAWEHK
jgi:hypothetical protein